MGQPSLRKVCSRQHTRRSDELTQIKLILDGAALRDLFGGGEDLKQLVEKAINEMLQAEVAEYLQADQYERSSTRRGYRNGYRIRPMKTRVGRLTLLVPKVRGGHFSTKLFARYQRSEQAFVLALMEMVVNGVSTRKVARITEELCGTSFSKSTVSELCRRLDPIVHAWNERSLAGRKFAFLIVDAIVIKVRKEGRVVSQSVLLSIGINEDGYREILGLKVGDSESEVSWSEYFNWLQQRGLREVDLVVSDDHRGLVNAVQRYFQGVPWQRCQTHLTRNILDACPKAHREELKSRLRLVFEAPNRELARRAADQIAEDFGRRAPKAVACLDNGFDDALAVLDLPEHYRRPLRTTNTVERLNQEIRRRERVIRIFPNVDSVLRLVGALLMEQHEEWTTGRKYVAMDAYWAYRAAQKPTRPVALVGGTKVM